MNLPAHAIGQAVFIRTGVPDYVEVALTLERVVVFSMRDGQPCALTLGFISASKGVRPASFHPELKG
jgi:6-phosphogluconolactonase (cycloisomerase 2 family)